MKKIAMSVALSTMLLGGLVGCGTTNNNTPAENAPGNNSTVGTQNYNGYRMTDRYDRHQGPLTDMLTPDDRYRVGSYGEYNRFNDGTRNHLGNYNNMTRRDYRTNSYTNRGMTGNNVPGMVDRNGMLGRDGSYRDGTFQNSSFRDGNFQNGSNRAGGYQAAGYHQNYDSRTAEKIADSVTKINGVRDARVVVNNSDIVVGVEATKDNASVQREVEQRVKNLTTGKNVYVVTDKDAVGRIRTMDDRLRTGSPFNEVGDMFTDIIRDLGNAAARPFQGTR